MGDGGVCVCVCVDGCPCLFYTGVEVEHRCSVGVCVCMCIY